MAQEKNNVISLDDERKEKESLEQDINDANSKKENINSYEDQLKNSMNQDQLNQLAMQQEQQRLQELHNDIQRKVFEGDPLSKEELNFVNQNYPPEYQKLFSLLDRKNKGHKLSKEEEKEYKDYEHQQILSSSQQLATFHQRANRLIKNGGRKVIHFTDPHLDYEDLETRIGEVTRFQNFDPQKDLFVSTGDLLPDLIDMKDGLEAFNGKRIAYEGGFSDEEEKEFLRHYELFLNYAGMSHQDIESGGSTLGLGAQEILQRFQSYFMLMDEPHHLTGEELKKFRETREEVHQYLSKAIHGHARKGYEKIKEMFDKYGITSDNALLVAGNHDVEAEMNEILGDYMVEPGTIKEVQGLRAGNLMSGSAGEALGFHLSKDLGWKDVRKDPRTWYQSEGFQKLKQHVHDSGLDHIDDFQLKQLIEHAKAKQSLGIADSALAKYFATNIKPDIDHTISSARDAIPQINPSEVDLFIGHGNPTHLQYAGAEERQVHDLIRGSNKPYLYGHIHQNDSKRQDGVTYLNPGTAQNYGHGVYAFDNNKTLQEIAFAEANPLTKSIDYRLTKPKDLSSEDKKYGRTA